MNQPHFTIDLAHSLHGRLRQVHLPHTVVYALLVLSLAGLFTAFGFVSSYMRMTWKVANYNSLRDEVDTLRERYHRLQRQAQQTDQQMASFQLLASEVSMAYGLKKKLEGPDDISAEGRLIPTVSESIAEYNFLKAANLTRLTRRATLFAQPLVPPSLWPLDGRLTSHFGKRSDPFSGEGAFHTGVDLSAPSGTPVRATGDGMVMHAEHSGRYGKLVVLDHGNGLQTYYAHLSAMDVVAGQEIRRGETVGLSGSTGRATSPHLHYEVRLHGNPVNPYQYLARASQASAPQSRTFLF